MRYHHERHREGGGAVSALLGMRQAVAAPHCKRALRRRRAPRRLRCLVGACGSTLWLITHAATSADAECGPVSPPTPAVQAADDAASADEGLRTARVAAARTRGRDMDDLEPLLKLSMSKAADEVWRELQGNVDALQEELGGLQRARAGEARARDDAADEAREAERRLREVREQLRDAEVHLSGMRAMEEAAAGDARGGRRAVCANRSASRPHSLPTPSPRGLGGRARGFAGGSAAREGGAGGA